MKSSPGRVKFSSMGLLRNRRGPSSFFSAPSSRRACPSARRQRCSMASPRHSSAPVRGSTCRSCTPSSDGGHRHTDLRREEDPNRAHHRQALVEPRGRCRGGRTSAGVMRNVRCGRNSADSLMRLGDEPAQVRVLPDELHVSLLEELVVAVAGVVQLHVHLQGHHLRPLGEAIRDVAAELDSVSRQRVDVREVRRPDREPQRMGAEPAREPENIGQIGLLVLDEHEIADHRLACGVVVTEARAAPRGHRRRSGCPRRTAH